MSDPEQTLFAFGPFGVSVCRGPYGVFKWQQTNITRVELTERRIRGLKQRAFGVFGRSHSGRDPVFDIPYVAILGVRRLPHPAGLRVQDVLELTHSVDGEPSVLSIAGYKQPIEDACRVLGRFVPAARITGWDASSPVE